MGINVRHDGDFTVAAGDVAYEAAKLKGAEELRRRNEDIQLRKDQDILNNEMQKEQMQLQHEFNMDRTEFNNTLQQQSREQQHQQDMINTAFEYDQRQEEIALKKRLASMKNGGVPEKDFTPYQQSALAKIKDQQAKLKNTIVSGRAKGAEMQVLSQMQRLREEEMSIYDVAKDKPIPEEVVSQQYTTLGGVHLKINPDGTTEASDWQKHQWNLERDQAKELLKATEEKDRFGKDVIKDASKIFSDTMWSLTTAQKYKDLPIEQQQEKLAEEALLKAQALRDKAEELKSGDTTPTDEETKREVSVINRANNKAVVLDLNNPRDKQTYDNLLKDSEASKKFIIQ